MPDSIVGVWTLRSFHMENVDTRERSEPFGPEPRGTLILHPDGRMAALIAPGEAKTPVTGADQAAATPKLVAYSGLYRLDPPDRLVTMVDVANFANWIGTEQVRTYRLDDDRLEMFTPPGRMPREGGDEATVRGILAWTREEPVRADTPSPIST